MEIAIVWILLIIVVTVWASRWGRSAIFYFLLSFLLSPIIGAVVLLISGKSEKNMKKCPACAEMVKVEAMVCRFCRYDFAEHEKQSAIG
jgi:TctA family transporter